MPCRDFGILVWTDLTGSVAADGEDLSLLLHVDEDISVFPFLSRQQTAHTLEFRFKAQELDVTLFGAGSDHAP